MGVTHPYTATGADDPAAEINKAEWNDTHTVADGSFVAAKLSATATDKVFGRSTAGAGNGEEIALTAAGRALIDDADAAAQRTTLGAAAASHAHAGTDITSGTVAAARLPTLDAITAPVADVSMNTHKITGVVDPTSNQHAATKKYVDDSVAAGVSFATPAIVLGTAAAAGAASSTIRSDSTILAFDATVPSTQAFGDAAATGAAAVAARRDHKHAMPATPAGTILGATFYTPGADADVIATTSTSLVDADATNAIVAFTAPASGNVIVELEGMTTATASTSTNNVIWGVRESTNNVGAKTIISNVAAGTNRGRASWLITGLTPGSAHTYKFAICTSNAATTAHLSGGPTTFGAVRLTVVAAP